MKKSFVGLAALSVVGSVSAQSSVTMFGVVDLAVSGYRNKSQDSAGHAVTVSRTVLNPNGYNQSRLGFRGTEDLGGGLAASFWLEGSLFPDVGTGNATGGGMRFDRRSTVSLSGAFGEIRLGRDYTPTFWNDTVFDPMSTNGVGTNLVATANGFSSAGAATGGFTANPNYIRASNSVGYFLPPNLGGFYGQLMYALSEKEKFDPGTATPDAPNNSRAGRYVGGRFGYASGSLDVAASYGRSTILDDYYGGTTTRLDSWSLGASYDFGMVKLFAEYSKARLATERTGAAPMGVFDAEPNASGWLLGATVPVGVGLIRLSYAAVELDPERLVPRPGGDPKADKFALSYVHNLSRRTALYGSVARISNRNGYDLTVGGPAFVEGPPAGRFTPRTSTGYDMGIRHAF